jgi:hypothetical protein
MEFVPAGLRAHITAITIQEIVKSIQQSGRHLWISEFQRKYGLVIGP